MNLIKIEIKGSTQQIDKFIRNLTEKVSDAFVFKFTRIPCVGETIQFGTDVQEAFRVTGVMHYTAAKNWCSAWGCVTVEPCNLLLAVPEQIEEDFDIDEDFDVDDLPGDEDFDIDADFDVDGLPGDEDFDIDENSLSNTRRYLGRLPHGICTPEEAYKLPILKALELKGGSAKTKDVLALIEKLMKGVLKKIDYQRVPSTPNETRWQKRAKWVRYRLIAEGLVKNDSPRGVWEISKAGYQYLTKNLNHN